jgi:magnesium transporter
MQGSVGNISEKTGMPPGSFISVGVKESIPAKFTVYTITKQDGASKQESAVLTDELLRLSGDTVTWIDSQGLSEPGSLQLLFETLNVPPLLQEDIINTRHRPKIEAFDSHLLVVTKRIALAHRKSFTRSMSPSFWARVMC